MFLETPTFPACPNFGAQGQAMYSVTVTPMVSGRERRFRNWARSLLQFDCTIGPRATDTIQEILEWWHAMGGMECGFRFRDWTDYKSCRVNQTPTNADQPLQMIDSTHYQLVKEYIKGARIQVRKILKPVTGTILLTPTGVVDYTTGIVTYGSPPTLPSWGGEFDVPVRFNSELPIQVADFEVQTVTFSLQEIRDSLIESSASDRSGLATSLVFSQTGHLFGKESLSGTSAISFGLTGTLHAGIVSSVISITVGTNSTSPWGGTPLHGTMGAPHGDGNGFTDGTTNGLIYGTINPVGGTILGVPIAVACWLTDNGTKYFAVVLNSTKPQNFFTSITINGRTYLTVSADLFNNSAQPGLTIWLWLDPITYPSGTLPITVT